MFGHLHQKCILPSRESHEYFPMNPELLPKSAVDHNIETQSKLKLKFEIKKTIHDVPTITIDNIISYLNL